MEKIGWDTSAVTLSVVVERFCVSIFFFFSKMSSGSNLPSRDKALECPGLWFWNRTLNFSLHLNAPRRNMPPISLPPISCLLSWGPWSSTGKGSLHNQNRARTSLLAFWTRLWEWNQWMNTNTQISTRWTSPYGVRAYFKDQWRS